MENDSSTAIGRAFDILEAIAARADGGMTNSDISRRLQIPKSSASYILRTLENRGYLQRDPSSGKYRLGLKLLILSRGITADSDARALAKPLLEKFVKDTNLSAHLAVLDNGRAVYVERVESVSFVKMDIWVGHRVPIHSTAVGKALVARLTEAEVEKILDERGMDKRTLQTIATHTKFLRELERVRAAGYALDNEENAESVRCIAAPVFDHDGKTVAAFGASATTAQLTEVRLPTIADKIKIAAAEISQQLGFKKN